MNKIFTFSLTLLMAGLPSLAGASRPVSFNREQLPASRMDLSEVSRSLRDGGQRSSLSTRAVTPVITNPEGEEVLYNKTSVGTFGFYEEAFFYEGEFATTVKWGSDNDVYFYNILSRADYPSYVKGTREGDVITVELPQTIYYNDDYRYGINLVVVKAHDYVDESGREALEYLPDPSITSVTYNLDEDGTLTLVCPGDPYNGESLPDYAIGYVYTDTNEWLGFSDFLQTLVPFDGNIVTVPEGAELIEYTFIYADLGRTVQVAVDGDKLYVKGINPNFPEGVFVAEIEGDKAYVSQNQIMGIYENCFMYTKCVYDNPDYDYYDDYSLEYLFYPEDEKFEFELSEDFKVIQSTSDEMYLCLNGSATRLYYLAAYRNFRFFYQDSYAGVPENPYEPYWYDEFFMGGTGMFFFYVPDQSVEATLLDTSCLYYRIYVDGEIMVFVTEENTTGSRPRYFYPGFDEPTTLVPYDFTNWQDVYLYADTARRMVEFYDPEIVEVGVQLVYDYEGTETVSDILIYETISGTYTYLHPDDSGIESLQASPARVGVYNLQGVKLLDNDSSEALSTLSEGLYIVNGKKVYLKK